MELIVFLPGMLLAYFPVKQYIRLRPARLTAVTIPLIFLLCLSGEIARRFFRINILWLFFPATVIMGSFYAHTLKITRWKSGNPSVFSLPYAAFFPVSEMLP